MPQAPPVNAELPPRQCSGAISSINTEAPLSRADKAAQVAALPAPTTITSCSGISIDTLSFCRDQGFGPGARAVADRPDAAQRAVILQIVHRHAVGAARPVGRPE